MPIHNWMSGLKNERKLFELCLPGSHDAGVYRDLRNANAKVDPGPRARCQHSNISDQAMAGSRVFDVRCFLRNTGTYFKKKEIPTMGHFFKEKRDGSFGEYGGTLMSALEDAASFLQIWKTEFLIFRIGHTKCTGSVADALQQFRTTTNGSVIHRGATGNLANLAVHQLRGKLLLVFDKEFNSPNFSPDDGYYPYSKYPSIASTGLTFCGGYSGGLGTSLALKKKEKGNWSPEGSVKITHDACEEHHRHVGNDHLLWVYWQQTGGDVLKNATAKEGMHDRLDEFLSQVGNPSNNLAKPNVIGHDFVDKLTCTKIVKMNRDVNTQF